MDIKRFKEYVRFELPPNRSVMVDGIHGCGKSSVVFQLSEERRAELELDRKDYGFVDIRLGLNDVGDLKGFPFMVGGRTYFAPPAWYPIHPEDKVILEALLKEAGIKSLDFNPALYGDLFLDEINRGTNETQQAAFQLVLDRRLGDWRIPDGWRIFAAKNPAGDGNYKVSALDPALTDRFDLVELRPTYEDFRSYGSGKKVYEGHEVQRVHPVIMKYLELFEADMDPSDEAISKSLQDGGSKIQSRRSWESLGDHLYHLEFGKEAGRHTIDWAGKEEGARLISLAGSVIGTVLAIRFQDFVEKQYQVLTADMVLDKWTEKVATMVKAANPLELNSLNEGICRKLMTIEKESKTPGKKQTEALLKYVLLLREVSGDMLAHLWSTPKELARSEFKGQDSCKTLIDLYRNNKDFSDAMVGILSKGR